MVVFLAQRAGAYDNAPMTRHQTPSEPNRKTIRALLKQALAEDIGTGDVTTLATVSSRDTISGAFVAKADGVVAGLAVVSDCFAMLSRSVRIAPCVADGARVAIGTVIARVSGPARPILTGERTALNILQRMSGIATRTRMFVDAVRGTGATILDTRKTAPMLRPFDKWAVTLGGGTNHRFGLYDMAFVKDNHIAAVGGIREAVSRIRRSPAAALPLIVEVTDVTMLEEALSLTPPPTRILLDNMTTAVMHEAVALTAGRVPLEASGNVNIGNVREVAATGVGFISVGGLTHSVQALDISLEITVRKGR